MIQTPVNATRLLFTIILLLAPPGTFAQIDQEAQLTYKKKCSWCHGTKGRGDGPASPFVSPPPRNFTLGLNKIVSTVPGEITLPSDSDIYRAISNGLPGTAMKSWKDIFSDSEIWGLVRVVKGFTDLYNFEKVPEPLSLTKKIPPSKTSVNKGRFLFRSAGCFECHGEVGQGDGNKMLREKSGKRISPRNLTKPWTFKGGKTPEDIFKRITTGLPGTPMPAFGLNKSTDGSVSRKILSPEERWHLVNFVLSLRDRNYDNIDSVIKAHYVEGGLPGNIGDKKWKTAPWTSFYLSPNLTRGEKLFSPLNDLIRVKVLYNDNALTLLLTWSDRTKSLPLGKTIEELGGEELYEDSVAVQFPMRIEAGGNRSYIGHGSPKERVQTFQWKSGTMNTTQTTKKISGQGVDRPLQLETKVVSPQSNGLFQNGQWIVQIKGVPSTLHRKETYKPGKYIPIAFATWDGSNGEKGSKHTFTRWGNIYLMPPGGQKTLLFPATVFLILLLTQAGVRRKLSCNEAAQ